MTSLANINPYCAGFISEKYISILNHADTLFKF